MEGVVNRYPNLERETRGVATLKKFTVSEDEARTANFRYLLSGGAGFQRVSSGEYVKLYVDGELMMSDTDMERRTNSAFVANAKGRVMIAGLGVGLILNALKEKVESGEVKSIVVYEKYQDVIDLVAHRFKDLPLEIRCQDILQYKPAPGEKYDTIYFDIWPSICDDNLPEIAKLHQTWKTHKEKGGWMSSWMVDFLRRRRAAERRPYYW